MQNGKKLLALGLLFTVFISRGQDQATVVNYINTYKNIAILEMQRAGVPAAITLAQGIHETLAGTSDLVIQSNNHFGIKCRDDWKGESVSHDDDAKGECFRKYNSPVDSYRDHSDFLKGSPRYASLFNLDPLNYTGWAYGLKKAGYATNPKYSVILIRLIEDYHLQDYTLIAMGKMQPGDEIFAKTGDEGKESRIIPAAEVSVSSNDMSAQSSVERHSKKSEYPEGEFKINDTRVIFAEKGSSFLSIAEQHNVSLSRLFDFNDLSETEVLAQDQLIYLQRKRKTGVNEFHTVNPGETTYDIAQQEGIRLETLLEYNLLEKNMQPASGEQLSLKVKATSRPALAIGNSNPKVPVQQSIAAIEKEPIRYRVQPKETIYSISKKYNVKIDDLVQWNQLTSYSLKTGQQLRIYK